MIQILEWLQQIFWVSEYWGNLWYAWLSVCLHVKGPTTIKLQLNFQSHQARPVQGQSDASSFWYSGGCRFDPRSGHISFIEIWSGRNFYGHSLLLWPSGKCSRLRITGSRVRIPLEARFFPNLNGASLHRAFHVHPSIVSKWLKYCWRDVKP